MRLVKSVISIVMLCAPLMGTTCQTTSRTSSEIDKIVCETAEFYRFKPYRETWAKLTREEQNTLKRQLDAFRKQECPRILGDRT